MAEFVLPDRERLIAERGQEWVDKVESERREIDSERPILDDLVQNLSVLEQKAIHYVETRQALIEGLLMGKQDAEISLLARDWGLAFAAFADEVFCSRK